MILHLDEEKENNIGNTRKPTIIRKGQTRRMSVSSNSKQINFNFGKIEEKSYHEKSNSKFC